MADVSQRAMNQTVDRAGTVGPGSRRLRIGAVVAIAVAVAFVAWLIFKGDDNNSKTKVSPPLAASMSDLQAARDSVGHPVYWAGQRRGQTYELTHLANGNIFIRYLPSRTDVGAPRPDYLTVGTYPFKNADKTLAKLARTKDAVSRQLPRGGIVVAKQANSLNVYLAYPGDNLQVEVYDRHPGRALQLASSGRIRPVP
jgi:hypothetical protein